MDIYKWRSEIKESKWNESFTIKIVNDVGLEPIFFYHEATAPVGQGYLIIEDLWSHWHTSHSVGLLLMGDQPQSETSIWKHSKLTRENIHIPGGIRAQNPS
jgi:metal-dependent hydrolase (beta-lactamase superfamily II)